MRKFSLVIFVAISAVSFWFLFFSSPVSAATLELSTGATTFVIGDTFTVDVKVNTEDAAINAAQATITYPRDVLEVAKADRTGSVFDFWFDEPTFSNESGEVKFIGGATAGFSGKSLQAIKIEFHVKGAGKAEIGITDAAITADDGEGTNVLSTSKGLSITSITKQDATLIPPPKIKRPAVPTGKLPKKPDIFISLYPDSTAWHNVSTPFLVRWDLPGDITDVATALDKEPNFSPQKSEGLSDNKTFGALSDGIWYLHIRFKNDVGWGPVAHYRLAVDTAPPLAFTPSIGASTSTDNPTPTVTFGTVDQPSGVALYRVLVDGRMFATTTQESFLLPVQMPGKRMLMVEAVDVAGNVTRERFPIEILPIGAPKIIGLSRNVYIGEASFQANGIAIPKAEVTAVVRTVEGVQIFKQTIPTTAEGIWALETDVLFGKGTYVLEITARDGRGAMSYPVVSEPFEVKKKPLFTFAGIEVTETWFFVGVIGILIIGIAIGMYLESLKRAQRLRKTVIATRDVVNITDRIGQDMDKMFALYNEKTGANADKAQIEFIVKRIREDIDKMKKYVVQDVEEIEK